MGSSISEHMCAGSAAPDVEYAVSPEADLPKPLEAQALELQEKSGANDAAKVGSSRALSGSSANTKAAGCFKCELKPLGVLGTGSFGLVELVEHEKSGKTYALKTISKGFVVQSCMQRSVFDEKAILELMVDSPFIIKLWETSADVQNLYFLLEPALGGDLLKAYRSKRLFGSIKHAVYYSAGVALGFDHLHARNVVYRDLKAENVMLTADGRIKLTDMGLAKITSGKTFTLCGSHEFFAPEMLAEQGYTLAVDWWCLGIFIFDLMVGKTPFSAVEMSETYRKIKSGIDAVWFPPAMQKPTADIIKTFCAHDGGDRLPMKPGGFENIKNHPFYNDVNWLEYEAEQTVPPYVPIVDGNKDTRNFATFGPSKPPTTIPYEDDGTGWDHGFATGSLLA
jgi:serine/threonine protein kinase